MNILLNHFKAGIHVQSPRCEEVKSNSAFNFCNSALIMSAYHVEFQC